MGPTYLLIHPTWSTIEWHVRAVVILKSQRTGYLLVRRGQGRMVAWEGILQFQISSLERWNFSFVSYGHGCLFTFSFLTHDVLFDVSYGHRCLFTFCVSYHVRWKENGRWKKKKPHVSCLYPASLRPVYAFKYM